MPVMLERWNDDKMDALGAKVNAIEVQLREQRQEMKAGFERVEDRFERVEDKFQRMQRAMTQAAVGLSGSIVLGFATVIAAVLLGA